MRNGFGRGRGRSDGDYSASALLCTPGSLSQEVGTALGAQAGQARLTEVAQKGGFKTLRRAAETPFNIVLEGRK